MNKMLKIKYKKRFSLIVCLIIASLVCQNVVWAKGEGPRVLTPDNKRILAELERVLDQRPDAGDAWKKFQSAATDDDKSSQRMERQNEVVEQYMPLVISVAERIMRGMRFADSDSIQLGDLVQHGVIGLIDAYNKYDSSREASFGWYARWRIEGEILTSLGSVNGLSRYYEDLRRRFEEAEIILAGRGEHSDEAMAEMLGYGDNLGEYQRVRAEVSKKKVPTEAKGGGAGLLDRLVGNGLFQDDALERKESLALIWEAINALPDRQRDIMELYYYYGVKMKVIGIIFAVSDDRISQILTEVRGDIKSYIREQGRSGRNGAKREAAGLADSGSRILSANMMWKIILAYDELLSREQKNKWKNKVKLWEERNYWRKIIWDMFKERCRGAVKLEWSEFAEGLGVDGKVFRRSCYDYLLEVHQGDLAALEREIVGVGSKRVNIENRLRRDTLLYKLFFVRALAKLERGEALDVDESYAIIKEFIDGSHQADSTFPLVNFVTTRGMQKTRSSLYLVLYRMHGYSELRMTDGLRDVFWEGEEARVVSVFDQYNYGWMFAVRCNDATGRVHAINYMIRSKGDKLSMLGLDSVQQTVVDALKPAKNVFGQDAVLSPVPIEELDLLHGRRMMCEMVRNNKFADKNIEPYPFQVSAITKTEKNPAGVFYFGDIRETKYRAEVKNVTLVPNAEYRIEFSFSEEIGSWICFVYEISADGSASALPILAFTGKEKDGKTRLYQLPKKIFADCLGAIAKRNGRGSKDWATWEMTAEEEGRIVHSVLRKHELIQIDKNDFKLKKAIKYLWKYVDEDLIVQKLRDDPEELVSDMQAAYSKNKERWYLNVGWSRHAKSILFKDDFSPEEKVRKMFRLVVMRIVNVHICKIIGIDIIGDNGAGGYSAMHAGFRNNSIYLPEGVWDRLRKNPRQLAAALAHEAGDLLFNGHNGFSTAIECAITETEDGLRPVFDPLYARQMELVEREKRAKEQKLMHYLEKLESVTVAEVDALEFRDILLEVIESSFAEVPDDVRELVEYLENTTPPALTKDIYFVLQMVKRGVVKRESIVIIKFMFYVMQFSKRMVFLSADHFMAPRYVFSVPGVVLQDRVSGPKGQVILSVKDLVLITKERFEESFMGESGNGVFAGPEDLIAEEKQLLEVIINKGKRIIGPNADIYLYKKDDFFYRLVLRRGHIRKVECIAASLIDDARSRCILRKGVQKKARDDYIELWESIGLAPDSCPVVIFCVPGQDVLVGTLKREVQPDGAVKKELAVCGMVKDSVVLTRGLVNEYRDDYGWGLEFIKSREKWQGTSEEDIIVLLEECINKGKMIGSAVVYKKGSWFYIAELRDGFVRGFAKVNPQKLNLWHEGICDYDDAFAVYSILNKQERIDLPSMAEEMFEAIKALLKGYYADETPVTRQIIYDSEARTIHVVEKNTWRCVVLDASGNFVEYAERKKRYYFGWLGRRLNDRFRDITDLILLQKLSADYEIATPAKKVGRSHVEMLFPGIDGSV